MTRSVTSGSGMRCNSKAKKSEPCGPLPEPGDVLTLPDDFGAKPQRKVVSARRAYSGTGLTPDHVEVTIV